MSRQMKRILAATDGGPSGRLAVVRAASIARETGAVLHAVRVIDLEPGLSEQAQAAERKTAEAQLHRHLARIRPQPVAHVRQGPISAEVIQLARAVDADLIVVGAHRGQGVRRFFIGTTAGQIARHGDRPLLVVRRKVRGPYRRVLVGVDASSASSNAIETTRAIAPDAELLPALIYRVAGEAKVRRIAEEHAIQELRAGVAEQRQRELEDFLAQHSGDIVTNEPILEVGDPSERLPLLPAEYRCDLITVGTHGRSGLRYALLGSVAEHVLRDTDRDVLLARQGPSILQ